MVVATSTWGDPAAAKRVLLLHGLTRSSQFWHRLAHDFASRNCFVVAPDLLGHGCTKGGQVFTIAALADALRPLFSTPPTSTSKDPPYDVVVGHSLGGILAAVLLPLLASATPVRAIIVDSPLELAPESVAMYREMFVQMVGRRPAQIPEEILQENPLWTREDAVIAFTSIGLCGVKVVEAVFDQNVPWSFSHYLCSVPENVRVTVLAADPAKWACIREEDVNFKAFPRVEARTVWGASHVLPLEMPGVVIEAALEPEGERSVPKEGGGETAQAENLEDAKTERGASSTTAPPLGAGESESLVV